MKGVFSFTFFTKSMIAGELLQRIQEAKETNLNELDLRNLDLTELPSEIGQLTNLQSLAVTGNLLKHLPKEIENLNNLQELFLEDNRLNEFPKEIIKLTNLHTLDLSSNQLSELPEEIYKLSNLKELTVSNNRLIKLPREINGLIGLQSLILSENLLTELPKELIQLTKLVVLDLLDNNLSEFPKEIIDLINLHTLDLSGNQISTFPKEVANLINLEEINFSRNQLSQFPHEIYQLNNLKFLGLDENQLEKYGDHLIKLGGINFKIWESKEIDPITFHSQIISGIKSSKELLDFYLEIRNGERKQLNEAKIIVLGRVDAGKTSLIERLIYNKFEPKRIPTIGINIYKDWAIEVLDRTVALNVWDFGGHEINHSTHQFFLTEKSIYILLNDSTLSTEANQLEYWLEKIKILGGNSPVIIVGNKIDEKQTEFDLSDLSEKYPNIKEYFAVSCRTGEGLEDLKEFLSKILGEPGVADDFLLKSWFSVKETLEKIVDDYISYEEFLKICKQNEIIDEDIQKNLLKILQILGIVFNFGERTQETAVMNPEWLTKGVYNILNTNEITKNKGILNIEALDWILEKEKYPTHKHLFIVDIMKQFELCLEIEKDKTFLIPDLLPTKESYTGNWNDSLGFEFHYKILFNSIMTKFIVKMYESICETTYWRTGVVLERRFDKYAENKALVKADIPNNKININIIGSENTRLEFLKIIREKFQEIHEGISEEFKESISEKLQIPGHAGIVVDYEPLEEMKQEFIFPDGLEEGIRIKDLLKGKKPNKLKKQGNDSLSSDFEGESSVIDRKIALTKRLAVLETIKDICDIDAEFQGNLLAKILAFVTVLIHVVFFLILIYLIFSAHDGWNINEKWTFVVFGGLEVINLLVSFVYFIKTSKDFSLSTLRNTLIEYRKHKKYRIYKLDSEEYQNLAQELKKLDVD